MLLKQYIFTISIFLLISFCYSYGSYHWAFRRKLEEYRQKKAAEAIHKQNIQNGYTPEEDEFPARLIRQNLDHFDAAIKETYQQRYWMNEHYWDRSTGPVFLYIGGESGLGSHAVERGHHIEMAKEHSALVFAVEHRYYGESINDDGLELENLSYLSSQQALADLATFHHYASEKYGITENNTWICFGGSYPGSLSAWFRVKYPHLVYGAIASSAPVEAQVNFEGYNNVVAKSLGDPLVNGSSECVSSIQRAFEHVDMLVMEQKYTKLSHDFLACEVLKDERDLYQLTSNLADVFMSTVQYNAEMPDHNITDLCKTMLKPQDPYKNLVEMHDTFINRTHSKCGNHTWSSMIRELSNTTVVRGLFAGSARQWIYQTCSQFAYYQTCNANTSCIFSKSMKLKPSLDVCEEVFKIFNEEVYQRVAFTNDFYGSNAPRGTRIVFVNGSIDPWHALSVLHDLGPEERAIFIPGTAHCANMHDEEKTDPEPLKQARRMIEEQVTQWLREAEFQRQ